MTGGRKEFHKSRDKPGRVCSLVFMLSSACGGQADGLTHGTLCIRAAAASSHAETAATEGAVPTRKKPRARVIAPDDVPCVFDDACIERLADIGKFPNSGDGQRLAEGIREAALVYARDSRKPTKSEIRTEIAALLRAADRRQYERVAALIEELSLEASLEAPEAAEAWRLLDARAKRPGFRITAESERPLRPDKLSPAAQRHRLRPVEEYPSSPPQTGLKMPSPDALRDPARRDQACKAVETFCRTGGRYVAGRMRPSGKRSVTWEPELYAPEPVARPPKRDAERKFAMHLQLAWLKATGAMPSVAATAARLGPFGRMVSECLKLVGADYAHVAKLINELNKRRIEMRARLNHPNDRRSVSPQR